MHPVVYDWFKANMQTMAGAEVPFYETQGIAPSNKNLPDLWMTMESDTSGMQRLTVGTQPIYREIGTVSCVFMGKSGLGIRAGLAAAQRLADDVRDNRYQTELTEESGRKGMLRIEDVSSPDPAPYEDGNWLLCTVVCSYTYDSVRGAGT